MLHFNGRKERAYALTDPEEYFAEGSEAYFGARTTSSRSSERN